MSISGCMCIYLYIYTYVHMSCPLLMTYDGIAYRVLQVVTEKRLAVIQESWLSSLKVTMSGICLLPTA